ncbi:MAG: hypothetical protein QM765_28680 [Myxococcales bacterium]
MEGEAVRVTWTPGSLLADTAIVERGISDYYYTVVTWEPLAKLPISETTFLDTSPREGRYCAYRVVLALGESRSRGYSDHLSVPIRKPVDLRAVADVGKVHLTWTNRATGATSVVVKRGKGYYSGGLQPYATLAAGAESFDDLAASSDWFTYAVESRVDDHSASTDLVRVLAFPDRTHVTLVPTIPPFPAADFGLRDRNGEWVFGDYRDRQNFLLVPSQDGSWTSVQLPGSSMPNATSSFVLDSLGQPQLVAVQASTVYGEPADITRTTYGASGLMTESIAKRFLDSNVAFALDGENHVHAFWASQASQFALDDFEYATNRTGSWVIEKLPYPNLSYPFVDSVLLCVDPEGGVHALVPQNGEMRHAQRGADGTWSWEFAPITDGSGQSVFYGHSVACACPAAGDLRVFFEASKSYQSVMEVVETRWTRDGWQPPQIVLTQSNINRAFQVAVAPDGKRQAVLCPSSKDNALYVDEGDGTGWTRTPVTSESTWDPWERSTLGFTPDSRLFVLEHAPSPENWVLYEEPAEL